MYNVKSRVSKNKTKEATVNAIERHGRGLLRLWSLECIICHTISQGILIKQVGTPAGNSTTNHFSFQRNISQEGNLTSKTNYLWINFTVESLNNICSFLCIHTKINKSQYSIQLTLTIESSLGEILEKFSRFIHTKRGWWELRKKSSIHRERFKLWRFNNLCSGNSLYFSIFKIRSLWKKNY